jgi:hypothetical protein
MAEDPQLIPVLTTDTPMRSRIIGQLPVVNGTINLRYTHPNLYRMLISLSLVSITLGLNFFIFNPTFYVYNRSNYLWGTIFIVLGVSKIVFLNFYRSLKLVRICMATDFAYILFFGLGTMQPVLEGKGSMQLPILYFGFAFTILALLIEPFINPWTAKSNNGS